MDAWSNQDESPLAQGMGGDMAERSKGYDAEGLDKNECSTRADEQEG